MSEILKDTSNPIVTICKCSEEAPVTAEMINCMKLCGEYVSRSGGWCRYYERGASMCTHIPEMDEKKSANKTSNLIKDWKINFGL